MGRGPPRPAQPRPIPPRPIPARLFLSRFSPPVPHRRGHGTGRAGTGPIPSHLAPAHPVLPRPVPPRPVPSRGVLSRLPPPVPPRRGHGTGQDRTGRTAANGTGQDGTGRGYPAPPRAVASCPVLSLPAPTRLVPNVPAKSPPAGGPGLTPNRGPRLDPKSRSQFKTQFLFEARNLGTVLCGKVCPPTVGGHAFAHKSVPRFRAPKKGHDGEFLGYENRPYCGCIIP